jgi:WD40 repeat protein
MFPVPGYTLTKTNISPVQLHAVRGSGAITKTPYPVVLEIMSYLRSPEAVCLMSTCRYFHFDFFWQVLCKLQSPVSWKDDPFHCKIALIQNSAKRALCYNRLFALRMQKRQEPWKMKVIPNFLYDLASEPLFYCNTLAILSNGNIVTGNHDIEIWSRAGLRVKTISIPGDDDSNKISCIVAIQGGGFITTMQYPRPQTCMWCYRYQAYIWSDAGKLIAALNHDGLVTCLATFPNGEILTGSEDTKVRRWTPDGKLVMTYHGHTKKILEIAILRDGTFATASEDDTVIVWSLDGNPIATLEPLQYQGPDKNPYIGPHLDLASLASLQNGNLATISGLGKGVIWSPDGKPISTFEHRGSFSPEMRVKVLLNDNIITVGDRSKCFGFWTPEGKAIGLIGSLEGHTGRITSTVPLPYGFITTSEDHTACIWSLSGSLVATLKGHKEKVTAAAPFSNGDIATLGWDRRICIWSADVEGLLGIQSVWNKATCAVS